MSSSPGNSNSEFETLSDVLQTSSPSNQSSRQLQSTGGGTALNLAEAKIVTHEDKLIQLQSPKSNFQNNEIN